MSAFTKGIYKNEVQCEIRMQVKIIIDFKKRILM